MAASQPKDTGFLCLGKRSGKQKIKNSTIINQYGMGNIAAVPSKTEAPVQLGPGNKATDNREAGAGGGAVGIGKGNMFTASTNGSGYALVRVCWSNAGQRYGGWILRNHASTWAWVPARRKLA
ncbi:hypothetical protein [Hymenobacter fodinae]|uniref:Uncharacterized protein n=1 Tax=Hymenobacter fodinae TaxID=2510796 RepID=A0A4Z0PA64_9BACT|nr:hypothetical protein [Hymenobacter fodinae]TGE08337.1 hypothetical protein EU556_11515 [Hymenobacter fodinae]